ncbi:MAG: ATP synthase F1 subunit gamma [Campylobacterota bacterium]
MANLKDIKRQIKSVKNTQKTTKAMKLVSTAKLKRTEELAKKSKVYAAKLTELIDDIAFSIKKYKAGGIESRYFERIENPVVVDIVFVTADKGLCGGFNAQTLKRVQQLITQYKEKKVKVRLRAIGKKGVDFFRFNEVQLHDAISDLSGSPEYSRAAKFMDSVTQDFLEGDTDRVIVVHNGYVNMITQEVKQDLVLPIDPDMSQKDDGSSAMEQEPADDEQMLNTLVYKYIRYSIYYALIDSLAAEHSARMQAMDAATNNAKDMVDSLTTKYNKARQESITTELIEIISGMEALK